MIIPFCVGYVVEGSWPQGAMNPIPIAAMQVDAGRIRHGKYDAD
jgi:hypothetical protein